MNLEDYLTEQKPQILAIGRISQIIDQSLSENYYNIIKGRIDETYLDEIRALINAIQIIAFGMRSLRKECSQEIEDKVEDDFTFSSVIFEDLL